ncbi:MAG: D-proline reductase (dithiol) proprotein PrdA [Spirochaetaceae bacterium]|nr:D-proline reductase (dithiol) proprotein PrdA [Spirochaetaceae bacterium]
MTKEHAAKFSDKPAIVCCRTVKGTTIGPAELEDPAIFNDLEESGLITITADTLTVGEVLGAVLKKDIDALTSLTADLLDGVKVKAVAPAVASPAAVSNVASAVPAGGMFYFKADKADGIEISFPIGGGMVGSLPPVAGSAAEPISDEVVGTLVRQSFTVKEVKLGSKTEFSDGVLTIRKEAATDALKAHPLIKKVEVDVITPDKRHVHTETIMDVSPVACKVEGEIGYGITNTLDGVVFMLTGVDEDGTQIHEFGSSNGFLDETVFYGRPGCPDEGDIIVRVHCVLERLTGMERRGPMAAHAVCDHVIQEIRTVLKPYPAAKAAKTESFNVTKRHGRPRVLLVKEIMGQGAMHDNIILPMEPAGVLGGRPNVDLGNVPVVLNVNEVRDGAIHALCCIGPASKEMTRHYFRDPIVNLMADDEELNLVGVVFIGSPQVNDEKTFVSKRLGAMADAMNIDGAIVMTEGFGNNHVDFASHIEELGKRGIKTVGATFAAYQGQLVVGNDYMDAMVEMNKDAGGIESERLGENTMILTDAQRAVAMLKNKLAGVAIEGSDKKWSQALIDANQKAVDAAQR